MTSIRRSSRPLKLLNIGTFLQAHVSDPFRSKGFRQEGVEVADYDYRSKAQDKGGKSNMWSDLLHVIGTWHPDIILINKGEIIDPAIIRSAKMQFPRMMIAVFFGDQRGYAVREIATMAAVSDVLLINNDDPVQKQCYLNLGVPAVMTWHTASDVDVYKPMSGTGYECEVAFMGGHYSCFPDSMKRERLIGMTASNFDTRIYGSGWPVGVGARQHVFGEDFARAVAGAKIVLGINAYSDIVEYTSNRTWNTLACGSAVFMTCRFEGLANLFEDGKHLIVFDKIEEAIKKMKYLLSAKSAPERTRIAKAGRRLIVEKHTYRHRAIELLKFYETWYKKNEVRVRQGIQPYEEGKQFV